MSVSVDQIITRLINKDGALLPILHAVQDELGYIPEDDIKTIAERLNLSPAEVHGVISFYHEFRVQKNGVTKVLNIVQVCRAEACQAMGARQLEVYAKQHLGIDYGQTTADGRITLEPVYCLGNCACSPSVRINDAVYARVDNARFAELISELNNGGSV